jgi:hypothetical protein
MVEYVGSPDASHYGRFHVAWSDGQQKVWDGWRNFELRILIVFSRAWFVVPEWWRVWNQNSKFANQNV